MSSNLNYGHVIFLKQQKVRTLNSELKEHICDQYEMTNKQPYLAFYQAYFGVSGI